MWKQRRSSDGRGPGGAEEWLLRVLRYAREESDTSEPREGAASSHLRVLLVPLKELPSPGSNLQRSLFPQLCCCRHDYSGLLWKVEKYASPAKVSDSVAND